MYCRNCGQKMADGDKFCSSCGAKAILTSESDRTEELVNNTGENTFQPSAENITEKSEPLFEPFDFKSLGLDLDTTPEAESVEPEPVEVQKPVPPVEDFDWNIHSFPGMQVEKTEDVDFNWSMSPDEVKDETPKQQEEEKAAPEPTSEPMPETIVSEEPKWRDAKAETAVPEEKEDKAEKDEFGLEEALFGGLDSKTGEAKKQSEEIDKFFTFHKKNEEFQKLLDQEYEKIKSGNILTDEMNTAAVASEEKFAARKPEDPMEELFASEGIIKGYEPKPIETDVLERIEAAEEEKRAREEAAKLIEAEKEKARQEAEKKAAEEAAEAKAAEEAARMRLEEEAKRAADARAAQEAAERERARAAARQEAEAAIRKEEERAEQERLKAEAKLEEQTAKLKAEAEARKAEAEARAKAEALAKAKAAEEAKAKAAEQDPANHISEMVRARETFFGQESIFVEDVPPKEETIEPVPEEAETIPEKTKAVDKAAILAGMATASEMVQRDRAFAAAQAAEEAARAAAQQVEETPLEVDLSDLLEPADDNDDILPETIELEEIESLEAQEVEEPELDFLQQLDDLAADEIQQEEPLDIFGIEAAEEPLAADDSEELPADLFSVEDLLDEETAPEAEKTAAPQVTDETLIMTEESVADLLNNQTVQEADQPFDQTMVFQTAFDTEDSSDKTPQEVQGEEAKEESSLFSDFEYDDDDDDERGGKGRLVLKICLIVLIVLLLMEVTGVVIKVAAPTSGAAKFIDTQLNKVIHLFTGDDAEYSVIAATEDIRQEAVEDKTALIKAEMGKNKDGNIKEITYNADLRFDPEKKYENTDLNMTQNLADVTWYKDANNKQVYYDQAIVGAMIAYDSQKVNLINNHDKSVLNLMKKGTELYENVEKLSDQGATETFESLQIGEIRQAGSLYYIWVAEKVNNTVNGNSETKKIYEMEPEGETMKIVASYDA